MDVSFTDLSSFCVYLLYRDAISHCNSCVSTPGCVFCLSSLECIDGPVDGIGASDDDNYCREGVNATDFCPGELNAELSLSIEN